MSNESIIKSLLGGIEFDDPRLYDLLDKMASDFYKVYYSIYPPQNNRAFNPTGSNSGVDTVTGLVATLYTNNLRLTWNELEEAVSYQIRYNFGTSTNWDSATILLTTTTRTADLNPLTIPLIYGNHTFLVKGINSLGAFSSVAVNTTVNIPEIPAPTITPTVIDNFVLLKWTIPVSALQLAEYNVYKNGSLIGTMDGTFEAVFETVSGVFEYTVEATDIVGNIGFGSTISVEVRQPPDYELSDSRSSNFSGTKNNCYVENGKLFACADIVKTYEDHFIDNSWASPQDQITAGYPLFIQPTELSGYYEEIIDYGLLISNTILTVVYSSNVIDPSVAITVKIAYSTDGVTYSAFTTGTSLFISSLQYAKIKIEFAATDDTALISVDSLQFKLDVKREIDSGNISALASDTTGTEVFFNKVFKDVESITLTVESKVPATAIYRFVDVPNPTSFFVYVLDGAGNRIDKSVSWKARGIV